MNPEPVKDVHPAPATESTLKNKKNIIFAIVVIINQSYLCRVRSSGRLDGSVTIIAEMMEECC